MVFPDLSDKGPILSILLQAGIFIPRVPSSTLEALPTWSLVQQTLGSQPRIWGLETCQDYQRMVPSVSSSSLQRYYGIAGMFNSGTNLLSMLLYENCQLPHYHKQQQQQQQQQQHLHHSSDFNDTTAAAAAAADITTFANETNPGIRSQVPWGKHLPANQRGKHWADTERGIPYQQTLPIVVIRDPYRWMQSMCRNPYAATWAKTDHCPNIMLSQKNHRTMFHNTSSLSFQSQPSQRTPSRQSRSTVPVTVRYTNHVMTHHSSLIHWWNEWYQLYLSNVTYPRIIVRYEDLLFYGQQVTEAICHCGGGIPRHRHRRSDGNDPMINQSQPTNDYDFVHWRMSAKQHHYLYMDNSHGNNSDHPNISSNNNNNHQQQHHLTDLVTAMIQYGQNDQHRTDGMILEDVQAAMELLDPILMKTFGYDHPFLKQVTPHHE